MGIDNFHGIAAGKNFVIYSFLGKQTYFEMSCLWYFILELVGVYLGERTCELFLCFVPLFF